MQGCSLLMKKHHSDSDSVLIEKAQICYSAIKNKPQSVKCIADSASEIYTDRSWCSDKMTMFWHDKSNEKLNFHSEKSWMSVEFSKLQKGNNPLTSSQSHRCQIYLQNLWLGLFVRLNDTPDTNRPATDDVILVIQLFIHDIGSLKWLQEDWRMHYVFPYCSATVGLWPMHLNFEDTGYLCKLSITVPWAADALQNA